MPRGVSRYDEARLQGRLWRPARGSLSYWIEPSQNYLTDFDATNLATVSEDFSGWGAFSTATVTTNTTTAPNGAANADTLSTSGASAEVGLRMITTLVVGIPYTFSCYAKPNATGFFRLRSTSGFTVDDQTIFDLINPRITYLNAAFTAGMTYVGGGWYRCAAGFGLCNSTSGLLDLGVTNSGTGPAASGGESVFIWGAQISPGNSETLYRPTSSTVVNGTEPTWRADRAMAAVSGQSPLYGTRLAASNPFKNRPPLIGD